jgi:hypothetical protein
MKRSYRALFTAILLSLAALSSGCGKACKDLEDVCNRCADANIKAACQATADENNQDDCTDSIEGFELICP